MINIDDPVAEFVSRYYEISTPESKIGRNEDPGEIHFFGAKNAVDYLRLRERVNEMADKLEIMSCDMTEIKAALEQLVGILSKDSEG